MLLSPVHLFPHEKGILRGGGAAEASSKFVLNKAPRPSPPPPYSSSFKVRCSKQILTLHAKGYTLISVIPFVIVPVMFRRIP